MKEDLQDLPPVLTLTPQQLQAYNDIDEIDDDTASDSTVFWDSQNGIRPHNFKHHPPACVWSCRFRYGQRYNREMDRDTRIMIQAGFLFDTSYSILQEKLYVSESQIYYAEPHRVTPQKWYRRLRKANLSTLQRRKIEECGNRRHLLTNFSPGAVSRLVLTSHLGKS